jgi:putative nucleotidyltransferase with HDIG domain
MRWRREEPADPSEAIKELEGALLDMIETLNAAVEARDPFTAGHSRRVRRISLAVGTALDFPQGRLDMLGAAALFHDVGKIGMPDSILTKHERLTPDEEALMREHVTRGAEIVAKYPPFQEAATAIRHHHERWDGLGYPDQLAGEDISLEAAILGLAETWDAMTTNRPYANALALSDAMASLREVRGKQLSPVVVDAFWEVAKRRPGDVLPSDEPTTAIAVI